VHVFFSSGPPRPACALPRTAFGDAWNPNDTAEPTCSGRSNTLTTAAGRPLVAHTLTSCTAVPLAEVSTRSTLVSPPSPPRPGAGAQALFAPKPPPGGCLSRAAADRIGPPPRREKIHVVPVITVSIKLAGDCTACVSGKIIYFPATQVTQATKKKKKISCTLAYCNGRFS
jgi:hypothetical protein